MTKLDQYRWKNRLLLVFSPSEDDNRYRAQLELLKGHDADFAERDLIVLQFLANQPSTKEVLERFGLHAEQFAVVLVGKDGGAKLVEHSTVTVEQLDALIDSMPMRQRERAD